MGSRVHVIGLQGYLFEGTAVRLVRYLQLTLRYHESVSSQEDGPREGRGDNQRGWVGEPRGEFRGRC